MITDPDFERAPRRAESPLPAEPLRCSWWPQVIVVASTFLAYAATLRFGYIYDDYYLVIENYSLRSWRFLPVYFGGHIWSFVFPTSRSNGYRPLLLIWLRLNYQLFGLHPWGWHLTIVAAHLAVTYLVYRLALTMIQERWTALAAGLLFGLHPIHVETIAEASWADQPLSTLFMLAAVLAWWRSRASGQKTRWLAASLVFSALALLSKESAMALPLLISALAWIYGLAPKAASLQAAPLKAALLEDDFFTHAKAALLAGVPYWVAVLAYVALRMKVLGLFSFILHPMPLSQALLTVPSVAAFYLRLLIWPVGMSTYYDTFYVSNPGSSDFWWPTLLLAGSLGLFAFWYFRTRRSSPERARPMAFAFWWLMLTTLPVLNLRYLPKDEIVHDRYLYLPSVGFCILAAIGLRQVLGPLPGSSRRPAYVAVAAAALFGLLGYATIRQSLFWTDKMTLRRRAHEIAPHNNCATSALGDVHRMYQDYAPAMELYQKVLASDPDYWPSVVGVGLIDYRQGNYQEAAKYLLRACALMPTDADALATLGMALLHIGRAPAAESALRSALLVNPQGKNYHLALAMALAAQGRRDEAKQEISTELAAHPENQQAKALLQSVNKDENSQNPPFNHPPASKTKP